MITHDQKYMIQDIYDAMKELTNCIYHLVVRVKELETKVDKLLVDDDND